MSVPCTLSGMRTLSGGDSLSGRDSPCTGNALASDRARSRAAIVRVVGRAGMTACIVLCIAAMSFAAEKDSLQVSAGQESPDDVLKEARREVISTDISPGVKIEVKPEVKPEFKPEERKPKIPSDPGPDVMEVGPRSLLLRKWDINADGRIDEREADVARARMRRERMDMQRQAGNDPLTGRPRGEKEQARDVADKAGGRDEDEEEFAEMLTESDDDSPRLPGTTSPRLAVPTPKSPVVGPSQGIPRASVYTRAQGPQHTSGVPSPMRQPGTQAGSSPDPQAALGTRAGWMGRWTQPLTGGARAGAPAATAGYGASGPQRDLNAGRYREELPSVRGLTPRLDVSGGLLPAVRQPRPPAAAPTPAKPPRITAEEIGGF